MDSKWMPGSVLTYGFLDKPAALAGSEALKKIARQGFEAWKDVGIGLTFTEADDTATAMVRIGFKGNDGYWSWVGREILNPHYICRDCGSGPFHSDENTPDCPDCRSQNVEVDPRTMNLDKKYLPGDPRGSDVPAHEIGHTIGLPHEHQSPFGGIVWNVQEVYDYFTGPPNNWPKEMVDSNVLDKLSTEDVEGSEWDPDSIMEYEFAEGLIEKPEQYRDGLVPAGGISERDKEWVRHWYPASVESEEITPDTPVTLRLKPGEAREFVFRPGETRAYDFQTSGDADTVMVLFEEKNGEREQLDQDDDSGEDWNSRIHHELTEGKKYILGVRLYWDYETGETTLKVW
jgi:hypothetical protein